VNTILIVEDYPDNMALIEEILEDEGYQILKAETAEKGFALLETETTDLILMDISLPQMDGLEATTLIKANPNTSHIPIIALTAHAMTTDREMALSAGCDDYITKPVDESKLLFAISELLQ